MRAYTIVLKNATSGAVLRTYSSIANGVTIPGALDIELDIIIAPFATPTGAGLVHIRGVSIADIGQAANFNGASISISGGMQKGLPLANPAQFGLLTQGLVFQAFGNWIGTEQSLDFIVQPSTGDPDSPKNIVHNWAKGTPLAAAIQSTLSTAFPSPYTIAPININPNLVFTENDPGYYQSLTQYATYIKELSQKIIGGNYPGVDIIISGTTITVYDGTPAATPATPTALAFTDMIGQPTWIAPLTIQTKLVMRSDLVVGNAITFPKGILATQTQGGSPTLGSTIDNKSTFQGTFNIQQVRHVGNFRQGDAASWVTIVDAYSTTPANTGP